MARGIGEAPERSPAAILDMVDYPATPEDLAQAAAEAEAPVDTINFLRALPGPEYQSRDQAMRDFAEADARFGRGGSDVNHRGDIGKQMTEPAEGETHHP
jgi:hypothetical protein